MGMDVYGKNPENETGEYFRRNVWGWRPLWTLVEAVAEDLASRVEYAHTNDGDGLDAVDSKALSIELLKAIEDGRVEAFIKEYDEFKANLPMVECTICDGTGIRTDQIGIESGWHDKKLDEEVAKKVGREFGSCNACEGLGECENFLGHYYTPEVECVKEFAGFLEHCGGFEIC